MQSLWNFKANRGLVDCQIQTKLRLVQSQLRLDVFWLYRRIRRLAVCAKNDERWTCVPVFTD